MSKLANVILNLSKKVANLRGSVATYTVKDEKIIAKYENPNNLDKKAYDTSQYANSQFFLEGYANPIKISMNEIKDEIEKELIPSKRYKNFMSQNVVEQMFFSEPLQMRKILLLIIGNIGITVLTLFIIVGLVG